VSTATTATPRQDEQREPQPPAKKPAACAPNKPSKYHSPRSNGRYSKGELKDTFSNTRSSGKLGCVKGVKIHLELDKSVRPVRQKLSPVPFPTQRCREQRDQKANRARHHGTRDRRDRERLNAMGRQSRACQQRQRDPQS
jgi:hypothetical protein